MSFLSKYKLKSGSFLHEQEKLASYGCLRAQDILLMLNRERWSFISMQTGGTVFPSGSDGKNLPAMKETWVQSLCGENLLEGNGNPLQYSFFFFFSMHSMIYFLLFFFCNTAALNCISFFFSILI